MKLLVTGGAGYVGSVTTAALLEDGNEVTVLDDLSRGHRDAVAENAGFVEVDLLDLPALQGALGAGYDAVFHFAALALVPESMQHPERYWRINVTGTMNLLEAMRAAGVGRLVFSSTCSVYGEPATETIDESFPEMPVNAYGASKSAADRMIASEAAAHGLAAVSLRYFNVAGAAFGLGERHEPETHLIPNVLKVAAGEKDYLEIFGTDYPTPDGTCIRDYIHVEDLADAHALALKTPANGEHRIYNLGNGEGFSVRQVADAARRVTGAEIPTVERPRRPGDPPRLVAASEKIAAELGWRPRKPSLEQMISDAWGFQSPPKNG